MLNSPIGFSKFIGAPDNLSIHAQLHMHTDTVDMCSVRFLRMIIFMHFFSALLQCTHMGMQSHFISSICAIFKMPRKLWQRKAKCSIVVDHTSLTMQQAHGVDLARPFHREPRNSLCLLNTSHRIYNVYLDVHVIIESGASQGQIVKIREIEEKVYYDLSRTAMYHG